MCFSLTPLALETEPYLDFRLFERSRDQTTAMQIYTDGSKDEQNSCGSGIFIKALIVLIISKLGIRTFVLFFRSELIAIDEALRIIKTMTSPDEIWILCDSQRYPTP
ncbi:RNase H domain-containing protein [Trichonephila clavipes]|nr:RNase H domain-containing protein [Trichonephila clavipes]